MSTIFSGYRRGAPAECPTENRYRLSEYHYSKLAGSQSLNKCRAEESPVKRCSVRRCLSAPDLAPLLSCQNCHGKIFDVAFDVETFSFSSFEPGK